MTLKKKKKKWAVPEEWHSIQVNAWSSHPEPTYLCGLDTVGFIAGSRSFKGSQRHILYWGCCIPRKRSWVYPFFSSSSDLTRDKSQGRKGLVSQSLIGGKLTLLMDSLHKPGVVIHWHNPSIRQVEVGESSSKSSLLHLNEFNATCNTRDPI